MKHTTKTWLMDSLTTLKATLRKKGAKTAPHLWHYFGTTFMRSSPIKATTGGL